MVIRKQFIATCKGCRQPFTLREYEGIPGGLYGSHHCQQLSELILAKPRLRKTFTDLKEIKQAAK